MIVYNMYDAVDLLSQGFQIAIQSDDLKEFEIEYGIYGDIDCLTMQYVDDEIWIKE